ncbi:signal transduction histidine-protein kinase/phosphatase DegS [Flavobacteriaceae bacterium UJ101]|nr:signal transduction histidine-protein kinase/phosphatase DegS [Flavobacteriaceae bacterium UJ101]
MKQLLLSCFIIPISILGQSNNLLEIKKLIKKANHLAAYNIDSTLYYDHLAEKKAITYQQDSILTHIYYNLSLDYQTKKDSTLFLEYLNKASNKAQRDSNWMIIMLCKMTYSKEKIKKNLYSNALNFLFEAEKISINHNFPNYLPSIKLKIANIHYKLNDTIKGIEVNKSTIPLAKQYNKKTLMSLYNNIGQFYIENNFDSASYYFKEGLKIVNEFKAEYYKATYYNNLGFTSLSHKKYDSAYYFLSEAKKYATKNNQSESLYYSYYYLGQLYEKQHQYLKAIENYEKMFLYEKEHGVDSKQKTIVYQSIAELYANLKQYDKAYTFQQKHQALKDSIFNIDKTNEFNKIRTEYEVENKNQQIELLTTEKEVEALRKRQLLYAGIGILIPLLLLILFYRNRVKSQRLLQEKEQQRYEAEKQRLEKENELEHANALIEGQDQERNRIAKEIHDGVGAQLAGLKLNLEQTNQGLQNENLALITQDLEQAFTELRSISHNLSTNYLEEKTLDVLLLDLKAQYEKNLTFTIGLYIFPPDLLGKLSQTDKHHLYRIVQELLNNTYKHAAATQVHLSFTQHEDSLNLLYEDNGKGFDPSSKAKGIGLHNIQERVKALNGTLTLDSQPQKGTTIIIDSLKTT